MASFVYSDLLLDASVAADGNFNLATNEGAINQSIKTILSTLPGERVMFPTFGSKLPLLIFEAMDEISADTIQQEIFNSIQTWENRVSLTGVTVLPDYDNNWYVINISYTIVATGQNIVFSGKIDSQG